jgi:alanine-synthesizing transaminase
MFSTRVPANLTLNRLTRTVMERRRAGRPLIDLTESNPTCAGIEYPSDLLASLADPRALVYAPSPLGLLEARRAVAADYARRGMDVAPERVVLTAGTSEAYSVLFKLLTEPGDEVLVPRPSYPLFELLTALDGVNMRTYDLEYDGGWAVDFASIERLIGARTRAVLVVNPNNPTGSYLSPDELKRLASLCAAREMALIADEVFADYELGGAAAPGKALQSCDDGLVFSLGGLSKSVGLPQVKLGWIAIGGPERIALSALERLEVVCDTYLSVSTPVQLAAAQLLDRGATIRAQIASRVQANYRRLMEIGVSAPSCRVLPAAGGWYAVVHVPTFRSEEDLVLDLLVSDDVLVHPGYFFDFQRESFLVVSLLVPDPSFTTGVDRLFKRAAHRAVGEDPVGAV